MVYGNGWQNNWYSQIPNQNIGLPNQNANLLNQNMNQQQMQQNALMQYQEPIQNGGFISVPSIDVARNYHVSPGTSVTFIDENAPYVYTKKRGSSQLDQPIFEKYRLVKEEDIVNIENQGSVKNDEKTPDYIVKADLEPLVNEINYLKDEISKLSKRNNQKKERQS